VAAITSGLAPDIVAWIINVGKSTCGNGATERRRKARTPAKAIPMVYNVVATGREMKIALTFIPLVRRLYAERIDGPHDPERDK
jgi:hypothetical protein